MINTERLLDAIIELYESEADYRSASARYAVVHGHGVNLDHCESREEKHIRYMYHATYSQLDAIRLVFEVLGYDGNQMDRAYSAARSLRKWYTETEYAICPPYQLIDRFSDYIRDGGIRK